jgi:hypothetical protein
MLFETKLNAAEIPRLMQDIASIAPYSLWKKRLDVLEVEQNKNPLLQAYFNHEFYIERSYDAVHRYHKTTGRYPEIDEQNYELFSFLATLKLVYERLTAKGQARIRGSVRDGLGDKKGISPFAAELRTAVQLMLNGFDVQFTDLEGIDRFDFLVAKGDIAVEIDCKAPSGDVGRQIHGWRFRELANQLTPVLQELVDEGRGHLVKVLLPGNLYGDVKLERALTERIAAAARSRVGVTSVADFSLTILPFELARTPFEIKPRVSEEDLAAFLSQRFTLHNVNAVYRASTGKGVAILVIQSARPDRVVEGIYRQLRESANFQFSGSRPAVLCVQLRAMNAAQLQNVAEEPRNGLAAIATRLFGRDTRRHLAGISFVATAGQLTISRSISEGMLHTGHQDVGAAYVFRNPANPSASLMGVMFGNAGGFNQ